MWVQLDPVLGATLVTENIAPKSGLAPILNVEFFSCEQCDEFLVKKSFLSVVATYLFKGLDDLRLILVTI